MKWIFACLCCLIVQVFIKVFLVIYFDIDVWNIHSFIFSSIIGWLVFYAVLKLFEDGGNKNEHE